jgi:hypothetical protein
MIAGVPADKVFGIKIIQPTSLIALPAKDSQLNWFIP